MDERQFLDVISGKRRGLTADLLRGAFIPLSWGYSAGIAVRNAAFDYGWRRIHRAAVPVISVGNLTTGGTGKTPFVAWLIHELQRRGAHPGLLSRGYGSVNGEDNDEARVIARLCPGVPHMQNRDRVAGVESLGLRVESQKRKSGLVKSSIPQPPTFNPQPPAVILLDDGFQHRRLHRDLDIVLIDALQPWGYGRLLPRGLLREPLSALRRADLVVITRVDLIEPDSLEDLRHEIHRLRGTFPDAEIAFRPTRLVNALGETKPLTSLMETRLAAFCGIGNPSGFAKTLRALGTPAVPRIYPDHYAYSTQDWDELCRWSESADLLLTTLKDLVKLPAAHPLADRVWAVDIGVVWHKGDDVFFARLAPLVRTTTRAAA